MKLSHLIAGTLIAVCASTACAQGRRVTPQDARDLHRKLERERELEREGAVNSITSILDEMCSAVLEGDQAAYLRHVWQGDSAYATEQRAWAEGLNRDTPDVFELNASEIDYRGKEGQWFEIYKPAREGSRPRYKDRHHYTAATLTARWRMPGAGVRSVEFPARFIEQDGRWLYAGRDWESLEADGIRVQFAKGLERTAKRVIDDLPEIIEHVHEGFEFPRQPHRIQGVKLYTSMRELQFSIYPSYVESLGGWNEPGESIKLLTRASASGRQLKALLAHEYGHVVSFLLGDKIVDAPWWALEGVAELVSEGYGMSREAADRAMKRIAKKGGIVEWERMADFHNVDSNIRRMAYLQGHHIMGYVSERFGRTARNAWLRLMAQGSELDEATRAAFGIGFEQLDREWRGSLGARFDDSGEPSTLQPIPSGDG